MASRIVLVRGSSWASRVPLIIGAAALIVLVAAWLLDGAGSGETVRLGS